MGSILNQAVSRIHLNQAANSVPEAFEIDPMEGTGLGGRVDKSNPKVLTLIIAIGVVIAIALVISFEAKESLPWQRRSM